MISFLKKIKFVLLAVFTVCIIAGSILLIYNNVNVYANTATIEQQKHDQEILKYYHETTINDNFENNKVNVILKSSYNNIKEIGFEDFKIVESVSKISSITYCLNKIEYGEQEKFCLREERNPILTLELVTKSKEEVLAAIAQIQKLDMVLVAEPVYIYSNEVFWTPTDGYYQEQWGLNNPFSIQAEAAWDITTGNTDVKVGVMEKGCDMEHKDLQGRIFEGNFTPNPSSDDLAHGTHVAGIIGAIKNNYGVAGVADTTMYLLSSSSDHFTQSLIYAELNNIKVINASFGYMRDGTYAPYNASHFTALSNYSGLFVVSAGNENNNISFENRYPACYDLPNVITVGSINYTGAKSDSSNYGAGSVDLFAPGENIYSTLPNNVYNIKSGTSMAAPHVTGVAALLLSIDNTLDGVKLKRIICENVDKATNLTKKCVTGGRLNAYKAVNYLANGTKNLTVTFDKQGGTGGTDSLTVNYNQKMPKISKPTKYGYKFEYYYDDYGNIYYEDSHGLTYQSYIYNVPFDTTLHAYWSPKSYDLVFTVSGVSDTTLLSYGSYKYGDIVNISAKSFDGYNFKGWSDGSTSTSFTVDIKKVVDGWGTDDQSDNSSGGGKVPVNLDENIVDPYVVVYQKRTFGTMYYEAKKSSCIAESSLITLADGSQKAVQELTGNEMLLVWNMFTGTFDTAPILCIDSDPADWCEVIKLYFSDGTQVDVISEHGFWDFDLNEYVYLDNNAEDYIGHWFNKQTSDSGGTGWTKVQLTDVAITQEYTTAWSPVTYGHLCYYVNGMLTMPGGIAGLFNIFEVDSENMRYDEDLFYRDIEIYGTYTYEEFAGLLPVTKELFNAVNGQYLKVAIGKGLIDIQTLSEYTERYSGLFA